MNELPLAFIYDRIKAAVYGRGIRLHVMDEMLGEGEGVRHKMELAKNRPFSFGDYFKITAVTGIDATLLLAQIAGHGHPLEIDALRGKRAPKWSAAQKRILARLEGLGEKGSRGFEEARAELRRIELLHESEPAAAEAEAWNWLECERRPGVIVGLLSALAVHAPRAQSHGLLRIACDTLAGQLNSSAGGRLAMAVGRCYLAAGFSREGLHILRKFALELADLYGDSDEHAAVHYQIGKAAAMVGDDDLSRRALRKAVSLGRDRLRIFAMQFLAYKELNLGDLDTAVQLYEDLLAQPSFEVAPKQVQAAIKHSRLAAMFAAGKLDQEAAPEFAAAVAEVRAVMPPREQVAAVMDFASFLWAVGKTEEACLNLEAELWNVYDLEDGEIQRKFAGLWEAFSLPRDTRLSTLVGRLEAHLGSR